MDRDRRLSLTVGGFALVALAALAVAILSLSARQGLFQPRYTLVAYFDNVQGLLGGAAVWLAGTQVGQVQDVRLGRRPDGMAAVEVRMKIDRRVQDRIRADSVAQITTIGLLGDVIIAIDIGGDEAEALGDGAEIATRDPFDLNVMIAKGGRALDSISELAENLDATVVEFRDGMGARNLAETIGDLGEIVTEVRDGEGVLHSLIFEPYAGSAVANLESSTESMSNIMREIDEGKGILHSLIYDEPTEQDIVLQFMEAGARLNSILGKVDRAEGTLGLMLNDPTLYEELKLLVGGANRSTVVRSLIDMVTPEQEE